MDSIEACKHVMLTELERLYEWINAHPMVFQESEELNVINQRHHTSRDKIDALEAALERIAAGTFGICVDCGSQIQTGRLMAYPYFSRCTVCQRKKGVRIY